MDEQSVKFEGWCVLELLGHRRLGGYVQEQSIAGHGFLRIDVPAPTGSVCTGCDYSVERCRAAQKAGAVACCPDCLHPDASAATQFYSPSAVYGITPVTEAMARAVAARNIPQPVARWELPAFRCDCMERDLGGEPKEYDFEAEDLDIEEDVLL